MRTQARELNISTKSKIPVRGADRITLFDLLKRRSTEQGIEYLPLQFCRHYLTHLCNDDAQGQLKLGLDSNQISSDLTLSLRYLRTIRCDLNYLRKMYRFDLEEFERAKERIAPTVKDMKNPRLILRP